VGAGGSIWAEVVVECGGALAVWALSLYVISRAGWSPVATLAALAMWTLVLYELGVGLSLLALDDATWALWSRVSWPGPALLPALWLLLTAALSEDEGETAQQPALRRLFRLALFTALPVGIVFALLAPTDLVRRWGDGAGDPGALPGSLAPLEALAGAVAAVPEARHSPPGPLYPLYVVYVLVCAAWGMVNLISLWRSSARGTPLRTRFRWLVVAAVLFLLGAAYLGLAASDLAFSGLPGHVLLLAGMGIVGWTIARYGALVAGEVLTGDAIAFAFSTGALVLLYSLAMLVLLPRDAAWPQRALPLLLLAVTTHVVVVRRGPFLDRLLYGRAGGVLRAQLGALTERVVRQPDTLSALADARETVGALVRSPEPESEGQPPDPRAAAQASLRVLVEGALRRLNDLPALSENPLLDRLPALSSPAPPLERATRLREALTQAIARLRPPGARPNPGAQGAQGGWLHYLVLQEAYVEGRPNKQIMQRYQLSEGTFHRARRRAIDALAADMAERSSATEADAVPATPV
jgi:hypothetical protein